MSPLSSLKTLMYAPPLSPSNSCPLFSSIIIAWKYVFIYVYMFLNITCWVHTLLACMFLGLTVWYLTSVFGYFVWMSFLNEIVSIVDDFCLISTVYFLISLLGKIKKKWCHMPYLGLWYPQSRNQESNKRFALHCIVWKCPVLLWQKQSRVALEKELEGRVSWRTFTVWVASQG